MATCMIWEASSPPSSVAVAAMSVGVPVECLSVRFVRRRCPAGALSFSLFFFEEGKKVFWVVGRSKFSGVQQTCWRPNQTTCFGEKNEEKKTSPREHYLWTSSSFSHSFSLRCFNDVARHFFKFKICVAVSLFSYVRDRKNDLKL